MAESHVLSGLVSKRCELSGEVNHLKAEIDRVTEEITAIDSAIKVFNPDYDLRTLKAKAKRQKNKFFKHGEANKLIQDVLRDSERPLNTIEIAEGAAKLKGLDLADLDSNALKACTLTVLSRLRSSGVVIETGRDNNLLINWQLA